MLYNRERAIKYMKEAGVSAIIATSPKSITYFSGYSWPLESSMRQYMFTPEASSELMFSGFVLIPAEGEPTLILGSRFAMNSDDVWIRDVRLFGGNFPFDLSMSPAGFVGKAGEVMRGNSYETAAEALVAVMRERGLADGSRIGVEIEGMGDSGRLALAGLLPDATLLDCTKLIRLVRMVKTDAEIDRMRTAINIAERAATAAIEQAQPDGTLEAIEREYRIRLGEHCADFAAVQLAAGGVGLTTQPTYAPSRSEVVFTDWCAIYRNYWADIGMSFMFEAPPELVRTKDAALKECVAAGGRALRPGVRSSEVFRAMCDALAKGGIEGNEPQGHGIGLDVREYPIIVPDCGGRIVDDCIDVSADFPLEENMVINLEIGHFLPAIGAIQNEQSFIVRSGGGELLIPYSRRSPVLAL
ncbi:MULTISPECIES: M24 family metallopeptidase [Aminobacter]|jgi:Xaa-Pro aminopeptidase|uniref:Xaa-Pro aminopeptidase n=1 Tax=Aminobacter ciceronei TaxID=150723 RepID=A0ABR6CH43_9HYPH|nr:MULTISPECIES: M24 family metallopeptidase [Aminobacter]MBA8910568.1 Xaa-Pro aminopeptidase [Aminobacter ciceronei]MBA9024340.1 Xaa-Pro aminopeptidase [Aminobacter ciceronei]MCX8571051.1 M24 family metallopeptidase [Aminobacter sp. MET-1]QOF70808.1 aminopeptidase P family protein [Aminobacter sp. SR38]